MLEEILTPHIAPSILESEHNREWFEHVISILPGRKALGVKIPQLHEIAKSIIAAGDGLPTIEKLSAIAENDFLSYGKSAEYSASLLYEEKMIWGFLINHVKMPLDQRLKLLSGFVPHLDSWGICDSVVCDQKWIKKYREETWDFLGPYFSSDQEFEVRYAIVTVLDYYIDKEWIDDVFCKLESIDFQKIKPIFKKEPSPFYVKMAVAWLLSRALAKCPEKTLEYVLRCHLPEDVLKLYVRKCRESYITRNIYPGLTV